MRSLTALGLILLTAMGLCWMLSPLGLLATPVLAEGGADGMRAVGAGAAACLVLVGGGAGGALLLLAAAVRRQNGRGRIYSRPLPRVYPRPLPRGTTRALAPRPSYREREVLDADYYE